MKQTRLIILLLAVCVFAFNSCKKSDNTPKVATQSISLKFNGTLFTSATPVAAYSKSQNAMQIIGTFGTSASIYLLIENFKAGSFDLATNEAAATFSNGVNLQNIYLGTAGNVVVTSFTATVVSGTFQFTGTDLTNAAGTATSGQFKCNYTTQ